MSLNASKKPRAKTCGNPACGSKFTPQRMGQKVCSPACALATKDVHAEIARKAIQQRDRQAHKEAKEKVKRRSDWLSEAQAIVNRYVRLRDAHLGCVSCDKGPEWDGQWHASHLRSVGSASSIRFNLWNIHKSCSQCNLHLSSNLVEYLPRVRIKIGDQKVDWLYQQNEPAKFSIDYLKRLKQVMSKKVRRLEKRL